MEKPRNSRSNWHSADSIIVYTHGYLFIFMKSSQFTVNIGTWLHKLRVAPGEVMMNDLGDLIRDYKLTY